MTVPGVRMDYLSIEQVMQLPEVRRAVAQVADRVASNARAIAVGAGLPSLPVERVDGTRYDGRPFSRVQVPYSYEYGYGTMSRLEILAAAVNRL